MNNIAIIHQDDDLIVIDKPSGILSVPGGFSPDIQTVQEILNPEFGRTWIVHRLDKETSGLMILARNALIHRELNMLFDNRHVHKRYDCIVCGNPPEQQISLKLRVNAGRSHLTVVDEISGKSALTMIHPEEVFVGYSFISAFPQTGYTHQIRAHLASIGHPILMDLKYTLPSILLPQRVNSIFNEISTVLNRTALHCTQISFLNPRTKLPITFKVDLPVDIKAALDILRGNKN